MHIDTGVTTLLSESLVIDLDGTLCQPPTCAEDDVVKRYVHLEPRLDVIHALNTLRQRGFRIVIHTARRMLTHGGNVEKVVHDVGDLTKEWLARHGVQYDELVFGKPYSSTYYVDDKAMSVTDFIRWVGDEHSVR